MNFRNPILRHAGSLALLAGVTLLAAPGPKPAPKPGPKPAAAEPIITQAEMNEQAGAEFAQADAELNRVYRALLAEFKNHPPDAERFRRAQRAWVAFRDAHRDALFPQADPAPGSIRPVCIAAEMRELTVARTRQLEAVLKDLREDSLCSALPVSEPVRK
jgi:uncharacterized protein YecT (DUF1311 family)